MYEAGLRPDTAIIEFNSVEQAVSTHDSPGCKPTLDALADDAERDVRDEGV